MTTPMTPFARLARQARAYSVPLLAAGVLAAGCGTAAANPGGPNEPAAGAAPTSASASASASPGSGSPGSTSPGSAPGSAASATPVPTLSGGVMIGAGGAACAGWPTNAPHAKLTALFTPVAVERCVSGVQSIKGKGEWLTATLERSTDKLATLAAVLMRPSGRQPDVMCPEFVVIPPQIVLFSSTGKELIPRLPVGACGNVDTLVLGTLATMTWQTISVRLVSKIEPVASPVVSPKTLPGASLAPGSPKVLRTGPATGVVNG
jgi:hypothetical protein